MVFLVLEAYNDFLGNNFVLFFVVGESLYNLLYYPHDTGVWFVLVAETLTGSIFYSHVMPAILGFLSIILICNGMMDEDKKQLLAGIVLFFGAGLLPFFVLRFVLGV
ncbi:conserved hypothetical protein [Methanothermobacter sp. MT-2]|nr:conserved hypothetical protein [Methanothermobacter sp. MT-2]